MKLRRLIARSLMGVSLLLSLWVAALVPARASQGPCLVPTSGPYTMAEVAALINTCYSAILSTHSGTSAPANNPFGLISTYQTWIDSTSNPSLLKMYDGGQSVTIGSLNTSTHVWLPYLTGGVSGGIPYFSAANIMASSAALANRGVVVGRGAGTAPETITAGTDGQLLIGQTSANPAMTTVTGDVTITAGGVTAIGTNKVLDAMLRQSSGLSLIGRSANSTGNVADITAASDNQIFRRSGTSIGFGSIDLSQSNAVGSSILSATNGGTNNAFFQVSGPATTTKTYTVPNTNSTLAALGTAQTWSALQGYNDGFFGLNGSSSGQSILKAPATGGGTVTFFAGSDTVVGKTTTDVLTNKSLTAPVVTGLADVQGAIKYSTQTAPAQITSNQNNYNPSSAFCVSAKTFLINSDAIRDVTGLGGGATGCKLTFVNNGSFTITFKNLNAGSTSGNQFSVGGDVALVANGAIDLEYDSTASKWRVISPPLAGAGSGTVTSISCGNQVITTSGTCQTDSGLGIQNCSLAASAASSALTIDLKDAAGSAPSATSPCSIWFRNATGTTGTVARFDVTGASSLVISSGSTMGATSSTAFRIWIVAFNDAGTFRIGAINASDANNIYPLNEVDLNSSTAEGGAGAADSAGVFYTGTAVTSKAMRILGYLEWNASGVTAGTWTTTNLSLIQLFGPGVKKPGDRVKYKTATVSTTDTGSSTTFTVTSTTLSFAATSAVNLVRVQASGVMQDQSSSTTASSQLSHTSNSNMFGSMSTCYSVTNNNICSMTMIGILKPNSTSSLTYGVYIRADGSAVTRTWNPSATNAVIEAEEIMGSAPIIYDNDNDPRLLNAVG